MKAQSIKVMKKMKFAIMAGTQLLALPAVAETVTVNDGWLFGRSGADVAEMVNIPHTWNGDAYSIKDYLKGKFVYRRTLDLKPEDSSRCHYLRLEGASKASRVLVNGHEAGNHKGGYTESVYPLSPYLDYSGSDIIEIEVDNDRDDVPPVSGDFTFFGGIYRDIWLEDYNPLHFSVSPMATPGVTVSSDFTGKKGTVSTVVYLTNENSSPAKATITVCLFNPAGKKIATSSRRADVKGDSGYSHEFKFENISDIDLWSPDSPSLYRVEACITDNKGKALDRRCVNTGFRIYGFDSKGRFILNGKPLKLRGVCRHQDMKPIGPALSDEMHRRDMQLAKDMGANFIRISHYPQDRAILDAADRLGLLVWEEIPVIDFVPEDETYADNAETALREMITQHRSHPSIVIWGYMNEILLRARDGRDEEAYRPVTERTLALAKRLDNVCRELDPSRLTAMAYHGSNEYRTRGLTAIPDINGWNLYQGWYGGDLTGFERFLSEAWGAEPGKPIIVSEYGAGSDRRLHSEEPVPFDFSMEYQQKYLEHYLPVIENSPFVAGSSHWNLIDFGSAKREESMPRINNKGILTADRQPKDIFYLFKAFWRDDTDVVHIASRDNAKRTVVSDSDTLTIPIKVYANTPEVTIKVNGSVAGTTKVTGRTADFMVPVHRGTNTLEAYGGDAADVFSITVATVPEHPASTDNTDFELAVNVGSGCSYTSPLSGMTWVADREYVPGSWGRVDGNAVTSTAEILGTDDLPLFQSMAEGIKSYIFDVPEGTYELEMGFADPSGKSSGLAYMLGRDNNCDMGDNIFSLKIEDNIVDGNYSPCKAAGSRFATRIKRIVDVNDGQLNISFIPVKGNTMLNSIKLRKI